MNNLSGVQKFSTHDLDLDTGNLNLTAHGSVHYVERVTTEGPGNSCN